MSRTTLQEIAIALLVVGFVFVLVFAPHEAVFAIASAAFVLACATRFYGVSHPSPANPTFQKALWGVVIAGGIYSILVLPRGAASIGSGAVAISAFLAYRLLRGLGNINPRAASLVALLLSIATVSTMLALVALVRVL